MVYGKPEKRFLYDILCDTCFLTLITSNGCVTAVAHIAANAPAAKDTI